jgi:FkbH-like protein
MGRKMNPERLAIVGPATWSPLVSYLKQALAAYGIEATVDSYGFGDDLPILAGRHAAFSASAPRGVFVLQDARVLFRNWLRNVRMDSDAERDGRAAARLLIESLSAMKGLLPETTWIIATLAPPCPNSGDSVGNPIRLDPFTAAVAAFNRELWAAWDIGVISILDLTRLQAEWGTRTLFDPRIDQLARFPGSTAGMRLLAERMAAHWAATVGRMKKVVVLDCDNTLWGGIVGEDGVDGIQLGEDGVGRAFLMFQEALLTLEARGVLLALCSRNNAEEVEEVFAHRPEMLISRERIAAANIGWHSKSTGIKELAQQLGLGLDSFVFVDDNPREREEVHQALPMVTVPEFPEDPADLPAFAAELGWRWFQRLRLTDEDRHKTEQYRTRAAIEELRENNASPRDFLHSLHMTATIHVNCPNLVFRMAQLTQKTNQFNLSLRRYTEVEISEMLRNHSWHLFAGSLADRFGDHGVVSLLLARETADTWKIDVLVMSCRVLGRGFERVFTMSVIGYLREKRMLPIEGEYVRGPRNAQVHLFLPEMGFEAKPLSTDDHAIYHLPINQLLDMRDHFIDIHWEVTG